MFLLWLLLLAVLVLLLLLLMALEAVWGRLDGGCESYASESYALLPTCGALAPPPPPLWCSLTRSAYRSVFSVCSQFECEGDTHATMHVRVFSPTKLSFSTWVNLLPRNGVWPCLRSSERITSFSANSEVLISAPSMRVCLEECVVSAPRSLPARSMKLSLPSSAPRVGPCCCSICMRARPAPRACDCGTSGSRSTICITWCDRLLSALAPVDPVDRCPCAIAISSSRLSTLCTRCSLSPGSCTCCLASSRHFTTPRSLSRSNNLPP
mmetsp:Transcript_29673/g.50102  ORF Transcript_29673/g.50102 Transcript_29673/m.50102 type:complete len:267 (+) Transcript_29673:856-1656(+)